MIYDISNDYKSTIINTETTGAGDIIKNAMEAKANDVDAIRAILPTNQNDSQKRIVEWYKYLNGNGRSRDTYIEKEVQTPGVDGKIDLILTEAGLEILLPETHRLMVWA